MTDQTMTPTQAVALCRLARALFPAQHFDEYTPDAWHLVLDDLRFEDCKHAIAAVAKREKWCEPAAIRAEVRSIRRRRLDEAPALVPPPELDPDDPTAYRRWYCETRRAIADGETYTPPALGTRRMPSLGSTFRPVENA